MVIEGKSTLEAATRKVFIRAKHRAVRWKLFGISRKAHENSRWSLADYGLEAWWNSKRLLLMATVPTAGLRMRHTRFSKQTTHKITR